MEMVQSLTKIRLLTSLQQLKVRTTELKDRALQTTHRLMEKIIENWDKRVGMQVEQDL